jgi:hypothetical protein
MSEAKNQDSTYKNNQRLPLIPKELHGRFKIHCVEKGITMQVGAIEAIERYIEESVEKKQKE